jgi:multidrug efflux pump subunit AcrA (membrane-fusion protein)
MATVEEIPVAAPARPAAKARGRGRRWRAVAALLVLATSAGGIWWAARAMRKSAGAAALATAPVRKGEFLVMVRCRGELASRRSVSIVAPQKVPNLQIVWLAPPNSLVKAGDVIARFDPSGARQQMVEKQASLEQAQATLDQALAENRIAAEQDRRDLAQARYDVERARLDASKQEIVSAIQAAESRVDLRLAEDKLRVEEATVKLHEASAGQKEASLTRLRDQALLEVNIQKERMAKMELRSPGDGVLVLLNNYAQGWMNAKPFAVGDKVWPGAGLAEIPDLSTLEMEGKIEEIDRARMKLGNDVRVKVDALPEKMFHAQLTALSPLTEMGFEWPATRTFRGYAHLANPDEKLRPGMNGTLDVIVDRIPAALSVPAKALYTRHGKPVVYVVAQDRSSRVVEVKVLARNTDEVAVEGVAAGASVSLNDLGKNEQRP